MIIRSACDEFRGLNSYKWGRLQYPKKKKRIKKEGYLSKIVYGVNFIINVSKGFLENKVETLAIYIRLSCQCI